MVLSADPVRDPSTLAIIGAGDADLFQRVIDKVTPSSDPVEDIHYLIVLARMTAPRTPAMTT